MSPRDWGEGAAPGRPSRGSPGGAWRGQRLRAGGGRGARALRSRGLTSGRERGAAASRPRGSGGARARPAVQTGGGPSPALGERGARGGRAAAAVRARASRAGARRRNLLQRTGGRGRPWQPAAEWVGGREGGEGLADAAASWWADPESPRKRGRLSAVRQARLCGGGSPLLQHSPWQSQSLRAAQPERRARRHCSPRPRGLRPPRPAADLP